MKRVISLVVFALVLTAGVALAQQTPAQPDAEQHHQSMQGGTCPMMGGMMSGGMMGMMSGQADSARMMQMRGEMMKAMGDIMLKYGKMMEGAGK